MVHIGKDSLKLAWLIRFFPCNAIRDRLAIDFPSILLDIPLLTACVSQFAIVQIIWVIINIAIIWHRLRKFVNRKCANPYCNNGFQSDFPNFEQPLFVYPLALRLSSFPDNLTVALIESTSLSRIVDISKVFGAFDSLRECVNYPIEVIVAK